MTKYLRHRMIFVAAIAVILFIAFWNCGTVSAAATNYNVWIGGNTVILPGVHIGDNTVIGAGSVVTKDIPSWCVAAGNPCKVIRKITEEDRNYYYKHVPIDDEALAHMRRMWEENDDPVKYPAATAGNNK